MIPAPAACGVDELEPAVAVPELFADPADADAVAEEEALDVDAGTAAARAATGVHVAALFPASSPWV